MEIWKDVLGFEGLYQVSNFGRVKSKDRVIKQKNRWNFICEIKYKGRIRKLGKDKDGYLLVILSSQRRKKTTSVHRLVAKTFIPNPENKPQVNHINGIKTDNRLENLEWCTSKENISHSIENKFTKIRYGEETGNNKLNEDQVNLLREEYKLGEVTQSQIANKFGVTQSHVSRIVNKKIWSHLVQ